jgi:uncharacterized membrane protein
MKSNFLTGVAILFPIVLTFMIVRFFVNLLTEPFLGLVKIILPIETPLLAILFSKLLILVALAVLFCLIGIIGRLFIGRYFIHCVDSLAHRIPIFNRIYKMIQESTESFFDGKTAKFSGVVLVPFPSEKSYSLGFVTRETLPEGSNVSQPDLMAVFVPGTPIPTIGYTLLYKRDDVYPLNLTVEEGVKFILSCGSFSKEIKLLPRSIQ